MKQHSSTFQLVRGMFARQNFRPTVVLLTSCFCLAGWHVLGNFQFWQNFISGHHVYAPANPQAAVMSLASTVLFLGIVPLLVVKLILRKPLANYGVQRGDVRFGALCCLLVLPSVLALGYWSAQQPEYQAFYPINPLALRSAENLAWHLFGQLFWYAAWEFHFRGFLQHGLAQPAPEGAGFSANELTSHSYSPSLGIAVQTLAATLAHFGRPGSEIFGCILGSLLWGLLAARTRSLLAGFLQHWLLGASLDFFIFHGRA